MADRNEETAILRRQIRALSKDLPIGDFTKDELMDLVNVYSPDLVPLRRDLERWVALRAKIQFIRSVRRLPAPAPEFDTSV